MKYILFYSLLICTLLIACNSQGKADDDDNNSGNQKKISKRDISITKANAYNDLFLDSMAMEKFIAKKQLPDSMARRIRSFYNARNYEFAWFYSGGLPEQTRGFWNLHEYATTYNNDSTIYDKALQKKMDILIADEDPHFSASDSATVTTELKLTQHFIQYMLNNYQKGYVKRKEMERFIPQKKEDIMYLADSLLNKKHKDDKYFEDVNEPYKLLKEQLSRYYNIAKKGGWPAITTDKKTLKKGISTSEIVSIKRRLEITGEMPGADTTQVFNDTLENAVKTYQRRLGFKPDGIITASLIKAMNVPVVERVGQLLINMGRMRWMPTEPSGNLILVNIPEFVLHVYDGKQKVFDMDIVVGKEGHNTTMFTGDLNQIVFSPYWNVPPSIVQKEILPAMENDPDYLNRNHMEITGTENGLPVVRQLPGPDNSLGKVKFLFPNSFNIYFHDTNAKALFDKAKRAYSHGCIRLSDPEKMAQYLLRNQPEWTPSRIEEAMNSGEEKYVKLKNPVPVFITYYTAWVDEGNQLNFREDIYGHDSTIAKKMFTNP